MSRAAGPCDSFNQSLGCVLPGSRTNYAGSCYEFKWKAALASPTAPAAIPLASTPPPHPYRFFPPRFATNAAQCPMHRAPIKVAV